MRGEAGRNCSSQIKCKLGSMMAVFQFLAPLINRWDSWLCENWFIIHLIGEIFQNLYVKWAVIPFATLFHSFLLLQPLVRGHRCYNGATWLHGYPPWKALWNTFFCGRGMGVGPGVVPVSKYHFILQSANLQPLRNIKHQLSTVNKPLQ